MLVLSSMQPDAARRKKGRSKPDRVFRQSLRVLAARSQRQNSVELDRFAASTLEFQCTTNHTWDQHTLWGRDVKAREWEKRSLWRDELAGEGHAGIEVFD